MLATNKVRHGARRKVKRSSRSRSIVWRSHTNDASDETTEIATEQSPSPLFALSYALCTPKWDNRLADRGAVSARRRAHGKLLCWHSLKAEAARGADAPASALSGCANGRITALDGRMPRSNIRSGLLTIERPGDRIAGEYLRLLGRTSSIKIRDGSKDSPPDGRAAIRPRARGQRREDADPHHIDLGASRRASVLQGILVPADHDAGRPRLRLFRP